VATPEHSEQDFFPPSQTAPSKDMGFYVCER